MPKAYSFDLRERVVRFVETADKKRREIVFGPKGRPDSRIPLRTSVSQPPSSFL
jgi:hypothetical protein